VGCLGFLRCVKNIAVQASNTGLGNFLKIASNNKNMDTNNILNDEAKELEDARLSYFSKYSDSQLDEIYEQDINARDIIDKIRKIRNVS
jgi:hypothetical protein